MQTIRTLDEVREYFTWLKTQPPPTGPHEREASLLPVLEAFKDWDPAMLAELFVQLGLIMCIKGESRTSCAEAYLQINDVLVQRGSR